MKTLIDNDATVGVKTPVSLAWQGNESCIVQIDPGAATAFEVKIMSRIAPSYPWAVLTTITQADELIQRFAVAPEMVAEIVSTDAALTVGVKE